MRRMWTGLVAVLASAVLLTALAAQARDPWIGTWKLNVSKSRFSPGPPPKSNTLKIESAAGGSQKHTFDGVDGEGKPAHSERIAKFDAAEVPVNTTPAPPAAATNS